MQYVFPLSINDILNCLSKPWVSYSVFIFWKVEQIFKENNNKSKKVGLQNKGLQAYLESGYLVIFGGARVVSFWSHITP